MRTRPSTIHAATIGLAAASALVLTGCTDETAEPTDEPTAATEDSMTDESADSGTDEGGEDGADTEAVEGRAGQDVLANPEAFVGQEVTIGADVGQLLGPTAFTVTTPTQELVVVGADDAATVVASVGAGDGVEVTGTVEEGFDAGILLPGEPLDVYEEWTGQHFIQATEVTVEE